MLEFMCSDVHGVIAANVEVARNYVEGIDALKDLRDVFRFATKDNCRFLENIVRAASMSDVYWVLCQSILADDDVEDDELEEAADLLSESLERYCWMKDYEKFQYVTDGDDVRELLSQWQEDASWLGGNRKEGAILRPFSDFVFVASLMSDSPSLYQIYVKAMLLIAKLILEANGVAAAEQEFYDNLSESLHNTETVLSEVVASKSGSGDSDGIKTEENGDDKSTRLSPPEALEQGLSELASLVGVETVKAEVSRLTNFLKVRQQRIDQGLPVPSQSLHFVFTGNPGTGKTTVARIVAKILYGFQILKTANLVEADRATMVGGYVGQTAIKTNEAIAKAVNGVLFIDEAYSLSKSGGQDYGQEAIDTLLKKMEDLRDKLVVIVAGYPKEMQTFISSNPGLQSRFTRFIHFDDYHVSDLCQIFDRMCAANAYQLTQDARANLAILFNRAFVNRDLNFGNARFVRNAYEKTLGNHSDRLCSSDTQVTREDLSTIHAEDLPYDLADGLSSAFDVSDSRWGVQCPSCQKTSSVKLALIGQMVNCKCGARFRCPWWNLNKTSVPGLIGFEKFERSIDLIGYEMQGARR
jgi:AAA+ superfamily predicted ATPase